MEVFDDKHIKNVVFVGAHHSGKTTLAETMLFEAGLINRRGTVENNNTVSDFHDIEHERGASVFATPLHTEWRNYKINIIDTPGLDDFIGEIISSIRVSDTILTIIDAKQGVEIGTEIIWNYIDQYHKPTVFVMNQIDHPSVHFEDAFISLQELVGNKAVKIQYPIKIDGAQGIIDILKMRLYKFGPNGGKPEKLPIPESELEKANQLHNELVEKAAENDESLMELYFEKGSLNEDEMRQGIKAGMLQHDLFPVFCVSAINDMGSGRLMGFIDNVAPAATDMLPEISLEGHQIKPIKEDPTTLFVFKTLYLPNIGKVSYFKVKSGEIKVGDKLTNARTGEMEVINQLYIMDGKKRHAVEKLSTGDIGATIKHKDAEVNDTLYTGDEIITLSPIDFPEPRIYKSVAAENKNHEEKLFEALKKIHSQDPTMVLRYSPETNQHILACQGELHLATIKWELQNHHDIEAIFKKPKINYRETIEGSAKAVYRHKKQSGGAGQFGEVHLRIEPFEEGMDEPTGVSIRGKEEVSLSWGGKLIFYNCIVGGVIDARFLPSIQKGIMEVMENGPLTGSKVRDIRVMVYDGKMHQVDSNDISFKIAGAHAFKEAFLNSKPKLLEPLLSLTVLVPEDNVGGVMTELQARRAVIQSIESTHKYQTLKCSMPEAELFGFSTELRSLTQGKATFTSKFRSYEPVPAYVQSELVSGELVEH
ncbi:elongation factor G [Mangrovimonas sp. AS39]|uniref:elongation factor G n=1 Tax=Mangrovimonas TaxID=1211036 RepID=UPI001420820D|nr:MULTISPECIES: elongation factor G [Mangrovimonas]MCF1190871.1 elongation factor G [Mangrovimonas futianensis]MCF1194567.1 elongation factor G [Mangrovimonas futianensis]NIK91426.1 elongation factor G [Mangrovimonas sp. CR14]